MSNKEFRIAVGSPDQALSASWKFYTQGDDAYISARTMGRVAKFSLHQSGNWRFAFSNEANPIPDQDRKQFGWKPREIEAGVIVGPAIIIPSVNMASKLIDKDTKEIHWLPGPTENNKLVIGTYLVKELRGFISFALRAKLCVLKTLSLRSKGVLVITSSMIPLYVQERYNVLSIIAGMRINFSPGSDVSKTVVRIFDIRSAENGGSFKEPIIWDLALTERNYFIANEKPK